MIDPVYPSIHPSFHRTYTYPQVIHPSIRYSFNYLVNQHILGPIVLSSTCLSASLYRYQEFCHLTRRNTRDRPYGLISSGNRTWSSCRQGDLRKEKGHYRLLAMETTVLLIISNCNFKIDKMGMSGGDDA